MHPTARSALLLPRSHPGLAPGSITRPIGSRTLARYGPCYYDVLQSPTAGQAEPSGDRPRGKPGVTKSEPTRLTHGPRRLSGRRAPGAAHATRSAGRGGRRAAGLTQPASAERYGLKIGTLRASRARPRRPAAIYRRKPDPGRAGRAGGGGGGAAARGRGVGRLPFAVVGTVRGGSRQPPCGGLGVAVCREGGATAACDGVRCEDRSGEQPP